MRDVASELRLSFYIKLFLESLESLEYPVCLVCPEFSIHIPHFSFLIPHSFFFYEKIHCNFIIHYALCIVHSS